MFFSATAALPLYFFSDFLYALECFPATAVLVNKFVGFGINLCPALIARIKHLNAPTDQTFTMMVF